MTGLSAEEIRRIKRIASVGRIYENGKVYKVYYRAKVVNGKKIVADDDAIRNPLYKELIPHEKWTRHDRTMSGITEFFSRSH